MSRILVVEDEAAVRRGVVDLLKAKGHEVVEAASGPEALLKAASARPDLILLDVMLPGLSGFDVLKALRAEGNGTPVIMLTAKGAEVDKVLGFELGVDDYVTKPFSMLELMGRLQAVLRRAQPIQPPSPGALSVGAVEVDFARLELKREGTAVEMPARALEILAVLAREEGRVVSRDRLVDEVWGRDQVINTRTIDNLVVKLRQVIEANPNEPVHLQTVHGRGYRLTVKP